MGIRFKLNNCMYLNMYPYAKYEQVLIKRQKILILVQSRKNAPPKSIHVFISVTYPANMLSISLRITTYLSETQRIVNSCSS